MRSGHWAEENNVQLRLFPTYSWVYWDVVHNKLRKIYKFSVLQIESSILESENS